MRCLWQLSFDEITDFNVRAVTGAVDLGSVFATRQQTRVERTTRTRARDCSVSSDYKKYN
jgi:hypothetical protein